VNARFGASRRGTVVASARILCRLDGDGLQPLRVLRQLDVGHEAIFVGLAHDGDRRRCHPDRLHDDAILTAAVRKEDRELTLFVRGARAHDVELNGRDFDAAFEWECHRGR